MSDLRSISPADVDFAGIRFNNGMCPAPLDALASDTEIGRGLHSAIINVDRPWQPEPKSSESGSYPHDVGPLRRRMSIRASVQHIQERDHRHRYRKVQRYAHYSPRAKPE